MGIKLGLLACEEVTTETRSARSHAATTWHLASKHNTPWRWIEPDPPRIGSAATGTAVTLRPANVLAPLAVEADQVHAFVTEFLARWGEASK